MAFSLQLGEVANARAVAERAIKTIHIRDDSAKKAVWNALLNLEVEFGSDETVQEAFSQACQYSDAQEMHESLASIYIKSNKYSVSILQPDRSASVKLTTHSRKQMIYSRF
jgi:rRNA biogenesis protein RRP5